MLSMSCRFHACTKRSGLAQQEPSASSKRQTQDWTELAPRIVVFGVGGAGGNAVDNMISAELSGVEFVAANTDAQALARSKASHRIQLGGHITQGLGAGAQPAVGREAAEASLEDIRAALDGAHMAFITAGMGGGTGTGAAPVIARAAREQGLLVVAVVTRPFDFEGAKRMRIAKEGIAELEQEVDTLIVIPNQNLFRIANDKTTVVEAFQLADEVLHSGVRGVTDLMTRPGLINLDFADVRTVMNEMGKAMMGTGEASGDRRALEAAHAAISNPLLDDVTLRGAKAVLINITGGPDMTLFEVDQATNEIRSEVDPDANIIVGSAFDDAMEGQIRVSVVATGIDDNGEYAARARTATVASPVAQPTGREAAPTSGVVAPAMGEQPNAPPPVETAEPRDADDWQAQRSEVIEAEASNIEEHAAPSQESVAEQPLHVEDEALPEEYQPLGQRTRWQEEAPVAEELRNYDAPPSSSQPRDSRAERQDDRWRAAPPSPSRDEDYDAPARHEPSSGRRFHPPGESEPDTHSARHDAEPEPRAPRREPVFRERAPEKDNESRPLIPFSLFGNRRRKRPEPEPERSARRTEDAHRDDRPAQDAVEDDTFGHDDLEIPAFLRRQNVRER